MGNLRGNLGSQRAWSIDVTGEQKERVAKRRRIPLVVIKRGCYWEGAVVQSRVPGGRSAYRWSALAAAQPLVQTLSARPRTCRLTWQPMVQSGESHSSNCLLDKSAIRVSPSNLMTGKCSVPKRRDADYLRRCKYCGTR